MAVTFACDFSLPLVKYGFNLQAASPSRATIEVPGRDGATAIRLTTLPGDSNLFGSGTAERCDLHAAQDPSYGNEGQTEWLAHSLKFPADYTPPPLQDQPDGSSNWGVAFDLHSSVPGGGQANYQLTIEKGGILAAWICGGAKVVNLPTDPGFNRYAIGPVIKGGWYDFDINIRWSSNPDVGYLVAFLNSAPLFSYSGATLYANPAGGSWPSYLKLANYHTPVGVPVSIIHSRVIRGTTQADVQVSAAAAPYVQSTLVFP